MWVAERAVQHAQRDGAAEMDQLAATCLKSYSLSLELMDSADLILTDFEANRFYDLTLTHLQTLALLNKRSRALTGRQEVGKNLWLLLPKHHHLFHCALKVKKGEDQSEGSCPLFWRGLCWEDIPDSPGLPQIYGVRACVAALFGAFAHSFRALGKVKKRNQPVSRAIMRIEHILP